MWKVGMKQGVAHDITALSVTVNVKKKKELSRVVNLLQMKAGSYRAKIQEKYMDNQPRELLFRC